MKKLNREEILKLMPFSEFLQTVQIIEPGKKGEGTACFLEDPFHFPNQPTVKASHLQQVAYELGEIVARSKKETRNKRLLGMTSESKFRKAVPPGIVLHLQAEVKMDSQFRGKAIVKGFINEKEEAFQTNFTFKLAD